MLHQKHFLPGGHDHNTLCWLTFAQSMTLLNMYYYFCVYVCMCECICVRVCWGGGGCMLATYVYLSYWATVWSNWQVKIDP